jgi:hypothetical protein
MPPQYQPTCENCHRGVLTPKKIYRMSSGTLTVGRIFLIGSIVCALASPLIVFGLVAYSGGQSGQEAIDNAFRRSCVVGATQRVERDTGAPPLLPQVIDQMCECMLAGMKGQENTEAAATEVSQACAQQRRAGTLPPLTQEQQDLYNNLMGENGAPSDAEKQAFAEREAGILGACFGIGLVGWLLILKKRVLQCSACGATVSPS